MQLPDIRIRDPFILPHKPTRTYFMCASFPPSDRSPRPTIGIYTSSDLVDWGGPYTVYEVPADSWAPLPYWAPEMHAYNGKYYLFATGNTRTLLPGEPRQGWPARTLRGTQVLVADQPTGPFTAFRDAPHTPTDTMALDGTLWVEDGTPYMVYCHEWVQIGDGTVDAVRLAPDLSRTDGEPVTLFRGSDAPYAPKERDRYVTDGPFLYRTKTGRLLMIWSSFGAGGYAVGIAESASGSVLGPWSQQPGALFDRDGGHGMIFRAFDGRLLLVLHRPNSGGNERARLFELEDRGDTLALRQPAG